MTYTIRLLVPDDAKALDDFLRPHTAEAYLIRANALKAGLSYHGQPVEMEYLGAFDGERLVGIIAYSWINTILMYAEELACLPMLAEALKPLIKQRAGLIEAILGIAEHADAVIATLGLKANDFRKDNMEDLCRAPVAAIRLPEVMRDNAYRVRRATADDHKQLTVWKIAYSIEASSSADTPALHQESADTVKRKTDAGEMFVLEHNGIPVSTCSAGHVSEIILITTVWTPPELRGRGYAKAVVSGAITTLASERPLLQEAVLFTANPAALRAYEAIGFQRFALFRMALLKEA